MTDHDVTHAMFIYGGSFVKALAHAWRLGDYQNRDRIKAAFAKEWQDYAELARLHVERQGQSAKP